MNNRLNESFPKARHEKLIVKELPDETLVYDLDSDKAHCLNNTAARVWKNCDGQTSIEAITASVGLETGNSIDDRVVWLALDQLEKFHLLSAAPARPEYLSGLNRRQLVRQMGTVALALPVILSIAAPLAAQTASQCACTTPNCRPQNCPCTNPGDCTNPLTCQGPPGSKTCQP